MHVGRAADGTKILDCQLLCRNQRDEIALTVAALAEASTTIAPRSAGLSFCKRPINGKHNFGHGRAARPGLPRFRGVVVKRHRPSPRIRFVAFENQIILAAIFHRKSSKCLVGSARYSKGLLYYE